MSKSELLQSTVMYSVNRETGVVVRHRLPFGRDSVQLDFYRQKGFTFERPPEIAVVRTAEDVVREEAGQALAASIDAKIMAPLNKHAGGRPRKVKV